MARVSLSRSKSRNQQRTYWVHHRIANVQSIGQVVLLFSTKHDPANTCGIKAQKVLVSNALNATTEDIMRWYSLRWQIEVFFREMKSNLGMCQYDLPSQFERVEGWVNVAMAAFCFLEWTRARQLKQATGDDKAFWQRARSYDTRERLRKSALHADLVAVLALAVSPDGPAALSALLAALSDNPDFSH